MSEPLFREPLVITPEPEPLAPEDDREPEFTNILESDVALPKPTTKERSTRLRKQLEASYTMLGTGVFAFDQQVGTVIVQQAAECAKSLDEVAQQNPKVRKALENMMQTSAWSGVVMAHLPIAVMVATKYVPYVRETYRGATGNAE